MPNFCPKSLYRGKNAPLNREHNSWYDMIVRCTYKGHSCYNNYGGRGITVCERWMGPKGFMNFVWDMGARPKDATLDRINPNDGYRPGNCRWATKEEQVKNRRNTHILEYKGRVKTISEWAKELKMPRYVIYTRIFTYNWTIERALSTPFKAKKRINNKN